MYLSPGQRSGKLHGWVHMLDCHYQRSLCAAPVRREATGQKDGTARGLASLALSPDPVMLDRAETAFRTKLLLAWAARADPEVWPSGGLPGKEPRRCPS